jgi:hypothetical protein
MTHSAEKDATWQAVADALAPYVQCSPVDHQPRSCPAVQAVMAAIWPTQGGWFDGTPVEMFGGLSPDLQEQYDEALRRIEEAERG